MSTRYKKWDIAKGIAIWSMVLGHLKIDAAIVRLIYFFHMPLFFIISGYFAWYSFKKYTVKEIILKKSKTILLPFISWSIVALLTNLLREFGVDGINTDTLEFLLNKIKEIFCYNMSLWFLWILYVIFLLFALAFWGEKKLGKWSYLIIYLIPFIFMRTPYLMLYKVAVNFIWFLAGYALHGFSYETNKIYTFLSKTSILYIPLYFLVFQCITINEFWQFYLFSFDTWFSLRTLFVCVVSYLYTILGILFILEWIVPFLCGSRPEHCLIKLGQHTLEIYAMHMMFVSYILVVPDFIKHNALICNFIYFPVYALCICIFIYILTKYVLNKIPLFQKIMFGKW